MSDEQYPDRAVLERKEREELREIARALSISIPVRLKKADIVDRILEKVNNGHATSDGSTMYAGANGSVPHSGIADQSDTLRLFVAQEPVAQETIATQEPVAQESVAQETATLQEPVIPESGALSGSTALSESTVTQESSTISESGAAQKSGAASETTAASDTSDLSHREEVAKKSGDEVHQKSQNHGQQASSPSRRNRRKRGKDRPDKANGEMQATQPDTYDGELMATTGVLDLRDEGYGFIRSEGYLASAKDVYVSISQVKKFALRKGDWIEGEARPAINNEKYPALIHIDTVGGKVADEIRGRSKFESLTPLFPDQRLTMEVPGDTGSNVLTARIVDLLCPIGKGQRGLIVSPPKAGKTTVMKQIARSIEINNPEVHLMVLLVDERPEEVTDMRRSVKGEVVSSTFDRPSDEHTTVAELALERAKRLVELGRDVVIILDGITRLARAYNLAQPATGRIMSGGVDSGALYPPKRFFGAARNIEEGGSLTILATALVETGSKMDEVIFEEFKGTGNMELRLDRHLAERRLYPSIDVNASSTRHEELLFSPGQLQQVWKLRRVLNVLAADGSAAAGLELLMDKIRSTKSNDDFLADIAKGPAPPL